MKDHGQFLEVRANVARSLHPSYALFDHGARSIDHSVKLDRTVAASRFVALVWDDRLGAAGSKRVPDAWNAVPLPFVGGQFLRVCSWTPQALWDDDVVHYRLGLCRFVDVPGSDLSGQGSSAAVSNQVELRSKPASAAAQIMIRRFVGMPVETFLSAPAAARPARTLAPSMHRRSESIRPRWSSVICRASRISAKTPSRRHFAKWWYTVCQGPNRSGRSRHGGPVCRSQKIPFSSVRRWRGGRPVRALLGGNSGPISVRCSSMNSRRFMKLDLPVANTRMSAIDRVFRLNLMSRASVVRAGRSQT